MASTLPEHSGVCVLRKSDKAMLVTHVKEEEPWQKSLWTSVNSCMVQGRLACLAC